MFKFWHQFQINGIEWKSWFYVCISINNFGRRAQRLISSKIPYNVKEDQYSNIVKSFNKNLLIVLEIRTVFFTERLKPREQNKLLQMRHKFLTTSNSNFYFNRF